MPRNLRLHQGHSHGPSQGASHRGPSHDHAHDVSAENSRKRLMICFGLTAAFLLVEAGAGLWTNSLALLSDAFHMLSDTLALGLAALAAHVGLRRPTPEKTFGFKRFEVLAAFANAVLLIVLGAWTAVSAAGRLWKPEPVMAGPMMIVAAAGLVLNLAVMAWLHGAGGEKNLNEESVFWHVLGDALGSVAALVAGGMMLWKGWLWADALAGLTIALILVHGAQKIIRQSAHILVEGVPEGVDIAALQAAIRTFPQVRNVHDLHLWTMTGRELYLSAHVEVESGEIEERSVIGALGRELKVRFGIGHITLQSGACAPGDCENEFH